MSTMQTKVMMCSRTLLCGRSKGNRKKTME